MPQPSPTRCLHQRVFFARFLRADNALGSALVRLLLACALALLAASSLADDGQQEADAWSALRAGAIVLLRHAQAPGGGDPAEFRLDDCTTQRNLDQAGRAQARRIGARFRSESIRSGKVLASQWCRTRETAELAFPGQVATEPSFNSFFQDRERAGPQTGEARALLMRWSGPGALVIVTHQVNITALTGMVPAQGEGIVLRRDGQEMRVIGRIRP